MQIRVLEVAPQVYASGQLFESDLKLVAKQGVRSIISTRPDHDSASLAAAAAELGIVYVDFPVDPGPVTAEVAEAFAKACDELERPLIVCGSSGGRSTKIWETAES